MAKFITITQPQGLHSLDEQVALPVARILDIVPIPESAPVYQDGSRTMIRCKDQNYYAMESLAEVLEQIER